MPEPPSSMPDPSSSPSATGPYQVVARRYRPQDFAQLVGQEHVSQALSNAISTGRIGHAYLFTGARGVGKTSSARIFAKALDCVHGPTPHPCNQCEICLGIATGEDVDVLEIDGASNRGIDEIRQLRQNVSIKPSRARYKVYIIDEVHMLTREAFNALLKTLEEPPEHVKFIFCTTEPTKLPITILSRCQRFDFAGIDSEIIAGRLSEIAANENVTADEGVFETLARRAAGSMRDAQSLLEQLLSFAPEHIRLSDVHDMLGTANDQRLFDLLTALLAGDAPTMFTQLDSAADEGVDFGTLIEQMMGLFRDLLVVGSGGEAKLLLYSDPERFEELVDLAGRFGIQRLLAALQILDQTHNRMRYSTQGRVLTELALARISHLDGLQRVATLIEQLRHGRMPDLALSASQAIFGPAPRIAAHKDVAKASDAAPASRETIEPVEEVVAASAVTSAVAPAIPMETAPPMPQGAVVEPLILDDAKARSLWLETIKGLSGMLATHAGMFKSVAFREPDTFVVTFDKKINLDYCKSEIETIRSALSLYTDAPVRLLFQAAEKSAPPSKTAASKASTPKASTATVSRATDDPPPATVSPEKNAKPNDAPAPSDTASRIGIPMPAPSGQADPVAPSPPRSRMSDNQKLFRETAEESIVAKAGELFDATLQEVRKAPENGTEAS